MAYLTIKKAKETRLKRSYYSSVRNVLNEKNGVLNDFNRAQNAHNQNTETLPPTPKCVDNFIATPYPAVAEKGNCQTILLESCTFMHL